MVKTLLNIEGRAVAYIADDGISIYLYDGNPVAWIDNDTIWGYNGRYLGWI